MFHTFTSVKNLMFKSLRQICVIWDFSFIFVEQGAIVQSRNIRSSCATVTAIVWKWYLNIWTTNFTESRLFIFFPSVTKRFIKIPLMFCSLNHTQGLKFRIWVFALGGSQYEWFEMFLYLLLNIGKCTLLPDEICRRRRSASPWRFRLEWTLQLPKRTYPSRFLKIKIYFHFEFLPNVQRTSNKLFFFKK